MKASISFVALLATLTACQPQLEPVIATSSIHSADDIDAFIRERVRTTGDFRWAMASDRMIWQALRQSETILSVGYKPAQTATDLRSVIHDVDVNAGPWQEARRQLLDLIWAEEYALDPTLDRADLEVFTETQLPILNVRVKSLKAVERLRASALVRYAEPMGYEPGRQTNSRAKVASGSGCGSNIADIPLFAEVDYDGLPPATKSAWSHPYHGIRDAWNQSTGAGQKLLIIDTGVSYGQENLSPTAINQGYSTGRTVERLVTLPKAWWWSAPETPDDGCGHGTAMAGIALGPRGTDGAAVGVAYNASLIMVRAAADVYLDESREIKGVSDALVLAGNRADVRVISMSMGKTLYNSQLADAIRYAYNRGKLIFTAGGTSFGWSAGWVGVIFPANMDEVQAITGIKDNLTQRCDNCHEGSQIDFVAVMEKTADGRHVPTLAMTGDAPSTVGGSSVATGLTAGMATLVWAQNPDLSRAQVLDKLVRAASNYPTKSNTFGWGRINVNQALTTANP